MYPNSLPSLLRITRPTACTISMGLFRGSRNATASSSGTSTPSVNSFALHTTRHSRRPGACRSFRSSSLRSSALEVPSKCFATTLKAASAPEPASDRIRRVTRVLRLVSLMLASYHFERAIVLAKAIVRPRAPGGLSPTCPSTWPLIAKETPNRRVMSSSLIFALRRCSFARLRTLGVNASVLFTHSTMTL